MTSTLDNNPQKAIYKFYQDHGRMGSLEGIFVASQKEVKRLIDSQKEVYFGEVLGKHSEIYGAITENEITMVSDDPAFVGLFDAHDLSSGYCPLDYIEDVDEDGEDDDYEGPEDH
jgi:hypothetical protein